MTMPFLRSAAPSRVKHHVVAVGRRLHVVHEPGVRHDRVDDHGIGRVADVDRVDAVAAHVGAEVGDVAVGVDPDLGGGERACAAAGRPRSPSGARRARSTMHGGARRVPAQRRGHGVGAGPIGDEAAVGIELAVAGREAPRRREPRDRLARRVCAPRRVNAHHVALAHGGPGGRERQAARFARRAPGPRRWMSTPRAGGGDAARCRRRAR